MPSSSDDDDEEEDSFSSDVEVLSPEVVPYDLVEDPSPRIRSVLGDGDCFFRAIVVSTYLSERTFRENVPRTPFFKALFDDTHAARPTKRFRGESEPRDKYAAQIRMLRTLAASNVLAKLRSAVGRRERGETLTREDSFVLHLEEERRNRGSTFARDLLTTGEWSGGEIVVSILAEKLGLTIEVVTRLRGPSRRFASTKTGDSEDEISIYYNGTSHYDAMVPLPQTSSSSSSSRSTRILERVLRRG